MPSKKFTPTTQRSLGSLDAPLMTFDLSVLIAQMKHEDSWSVDKRNVITFEPLCRRMRTLRRAFKQLSSGVYPSRADQRRERYRPAVISGGVGGIEGLDSGRGRG